MKKQVARARLVALDVLEQVAEGGYASDLLREATQNLSPRDAGLAGQIVFGSLRVQNQLDYLIEKYSGRRADSLDLSVRLALRTAIYQLRYLERIPPHAAVDDAVEFVKQRKRAATGLTNAVLRKTNRDKVAWPTEALALGCPEWLLDRWTRHYGVEEAKAIAAAALKEPEAFVRVREGQIIPPGIELESTPITGCYRLLSPLPEGMRLQDIGSQAVVPMLGLTSQHSYLDLCAAPGNKTMQALEANPGCAVACDISERRLQFVQLPSWRVVLDASERLPFNVKFDRILIDAPCSGTGTLARNPEIKWRIQEADLLRQRTRQVSIIEQAAEVLAPGGKILYATCSLEPEENESVIDEAILTTNLVRETHMLRLPGRDPGDGFFAVVLCKL